MSGITKKCSGLSVNSKTKKLFSLVMIFNEHNELLLGMKKRGFGAGRWNGFGGKIQLNETINECAKRETVEECGIVVEHLYPSAVITFEFKGDPQLMEVHVFRCDSFQGVPKETEEMRPMWFKLEDIPYKDMWPDDIIWYPLLFQKKRFNAYFLFEGHDVILEQKIEEL